MVELPGLEGSHTLECPKCGELIVLFISDLEMTDECIGDGTSINIKFRTEITEASLEQHRDCLDLSRMLSVGITIEDEDGMMNG